jgi:hypothetical protein
MLDQESAGFSRRSDNVSSVYPGGSAVTPESIPERFPTLLHRNL